jgi:hypothetical protein
MPVNLKERSVALASQVKGLGSDENHQVVADKFQERSNKIQQLENELKPVTGSIRLLRQHGVNFSIPKTEVGGFVSLLEEYSEQAQNSPHLFTQQDDRWRFQLTTPLTDKISVWKGRISREWERFLVRNLPTDDELLEVLSSISKFAAPAGKILDLSRRCDHLYEIELPTESNFQQVAVFKEQLSDLWDQLGEQGIPEQIREFLLSASQQAATLDDITPEITNWLKENQVDSLIRVGFRSTD